MHMALPSRPHLRLASLSGHVSPLPQGHKAAAAAAADASLVALCTHEGGPHVAAYLDGLAEDPRVSHVVLADPTGHWVGQAKDILGPKLLAKTYTDPIRMLAEVRPPMAVVAMEAVLAPPVIEAALRAGCHVLAEKPACVDLEAFDRLQNISLQEGRHLMLAFANRIRPEVQRAAELSAGGSLGKLYACEMHTVADQKRLTNPAYHSRWEASQARAGGGHLIWLGVHFLDMANVLMGCAPTECTGFTANVGGQPLDVEDAAAAALRFENGALGTITSGYYNAGGPKHSHIKLWGSKGWLELNFEPIANDGRGRAPLRWEIYGGEHEDVQEYLPPEGTAGGYGPYVSACVSAALGSGGSGTTVPPPVQPSEARAVLATVFAIYESQRTGRAVQIA